MDIFGHAFFYHKSAHNQVQAAITRAGLSQRQFSLLRDQIFRKYTPGEDEYDLGSYDPFYFPSTNIETPVPPGLYALKKVMMGIAEDRGVEGDISGRAAYVDFEKTVYKAIAEIPYQTLEQISAEEPLEINQFVDAHGLWNNTHASEWALRLPQFALFPSSPHSLKHLGMWGGKDTYDLMLVNTQNAMRWLREQKFKEKDGGKITCPHPESPTGFVTVDFVLSLSGDMVALRNQSGNERAFGHDQASCVWCDCDKIHLNTTCVPCGPDGFTYQCPHKLRTYADHAHAAHEFAHEFEKEFTCPCCDEHITRENYASKRAAMNKTARKNHAGKHGGQTLGRRPVFPVDMDRVYICACHARKNLTGRLFYYAICQRIETDTEALDLHKYITKTLAIDMPKSFCKKKSKKVVEWNRIPSFQGAADDQILINFVSILLKVCDPNKAMDKPHFDKTLDCLSRLIDWRNAVYKRAHRNSFPFPGAAKVQIRGCIAQGKCTLQLVGIRVG